MKNRILLLVLLCNICVILFADPLRLGSIEASTIPPLPIDALKKIEIGYNDTLIEITLPDTFNLKLYGGNIFGGTLRYTNPIKTRSILSLNADVNKNFDFSDYLFANCLIRYGWLWKNFWQDVSLSLTRNIRLPFDYTQYYENISIGYNPTWFIGSGNLSLDNQIRLSRYYDTISNIFFVSNSNVNINMPTGLGTFNYCTDLLSQSLNKVMFNNNISAKIELTNLIAIGDYFFTKPGVHYNLNKGKVGGSITAGIKLRDVKTFVDVKYQSIQHFYYDTLYIKVCPYLVNTEVSRYPICDYDIGFSLFYKKIGFESRYRRFNSYLSLQSHDRYLQTKIIDTLYQEISFQLNAQYRNLDNHLSVRYPIGKNFITPSLHVSDSIRYHLGKFKIALRFDFIGNRTLPDYSLFSINLIYQYKLFEFAGYIENIFDNKFEVIPNQLNKARKYFLGLGVSIY